MVNARRFVAAFLLCTASACAAPDEPLGSTPTFSTVVLSPANLVGPGVVQISARLSELSGAPRPGIRTQIAVEGCEVLQTAPTSNADGLVQAAVLNAAPGQRAVSILDLDGVDIQPTASTTAARLQVLMPLTQGGSDIAPGTALHQQAIARDSSGAIDASARGTVHFTSTDPVATLPYDSPLEAADRGVKTFNDGIVLWTPGMQTVEAINLDTGASLGSATYRVGPAVFGPLLFGQSPGSTVAGQPVSLTLTALDANNRVNRNYRGVVRFASSDANAQLPAPTAFALSDAGSRSFTFTLTAAGAQTLTASDSRLSSTPLPLQVLPAAAQSLAIEAGQFTAGIGGSAAVRAVDAFGNTASGYHGTLLVSTDDAGASYPLTQRFFPNVAGVSSAGPIVFQNAGAHTLTVADANAGGLQPATVPVQVSAGVLGSWQVSVDSPNVMAGVPVPVNVTVLDPFGNVLPSYRGTLALSSTDPNAVLPAPHPFTASDAGAYVFAGVTLFAARPASLVATDVATGSSFSTTVQVMPNSPNALLWRNTPDTSAVLRPTAASVAVVDAYGNPVPITDTLHFSSSDPQAAVPGDLALTGAASAAPSFTFATPGSQTFAASLLQLPLSSSQPTTVYGVADVSCGNDFTCARFTHGQVKCWGSNSGGILGLGDTQDRGNLPGDMRGNLPFIDLGIGRTALQLAAGQNFTCALLDTLAVKCWGNASNPLGLGDPYNRGDQAGTMGDALPAIDLGTGRTATAIAVGQNACAILDDHTLKCWGDNSSGALGQEDLLPRGANPNEMGDALPAVSLGTGRTAMQTLVAGGASCARLDNGCVKCWGSNYFGILSDNYNYAGTGWEANTMGDNLACINLGTGRTAVDIVGIEHSVCARLDDATTRCWGYNQSGELGLGDTAERTDVTTLPALDLGAPPLQIASSANAANFCARMPDGSVKCWGPNSFGQLGLGDTQNRGDQPNQMGSNLPTVDLGSQRTARALSAGANNSCAVLDTYELKCWGTSFSGELGLGRSASYIYGADPSTTGDGIPTVKLW